MRFLLTSALVLVMAAPAVAAPGDPRLMHGTLEWPPALSAEPFVIVRGDDGRLYYVDVSAAQRRGPGALTGGARVALLGIEGTKAQEITALAIGAGDAAALVRAITGGPAGASPTEAVSTTPPAAPAAAPSHASALPAPVAAPPQVSATTAATPASQRANTVAPHPSPAPSPEPVAPVPSPVPSAVAIAPSPRASAPAAVTPKLSFSPSPPAEGRRWLEVRGVVQGASGRTLVLHSDDGNVFAIDMSELNANLTDSIKPGMTVSVFGDPLERRLRARGVMYGEEPPARPKRGAGDGTRKPSR